MGVVIYNTTEHPITVSGHSIGGKEWLHVEDTSPLLKRRGTGIIESDIPSTENVAEGAAEAVEALTGSVKPVAFLPKKASKQKSKHMGDTEKDTPSESESEA